MKWNALVFSVIFITTSAAAVTCDQVMDLTGELEARLPFAFSELGLQVQKFPAGERVRTATQDFDLVKKYWISTYVFADDAEKDATDMAEAIVYVNLIKDHYGDCYVHFWSGTYKHPPYKIDEIDPYTREVRFADFCLKVRGTLEHEQADHCAS